MIKTDYQDTFFAKYSKYLSDPEVAKNHNRIFDIFEKTVRYTDIQHNCIVDYGCGTCELGRYVQSAMLSSYIGVDINISRANCKIAKLVESTYHDYIPEKASI